MHGLILRWIYMMISTIQLCHSANDDLLNVMVNSIKKSDKDCSEFFPDNTTFSSPLYIHLKYPIMLKIQSEIILSKHYSNEIQSIENFLYLFDSYLLQLGSDRSNIPLSDYKRHLEYVLLSLKNIHPNIRTVGLCLGTDQFINSDRDQADHYLCKQDLNVLNNTKKIKRINNNTYEIHWEPATCFMSKKTVQFPLRLIYNHRRSTHNLIRIYFEFEVREFRINQCETELHRCREETTKCIYNLFPARKIFATGNYLCQCRKGFFISQNTTNSTGFLGYQVEKEYLKYDENDPIKSGYYKYNCQPCKYGCDSCTNNKPCIVLTENVLLQGLPLAFQSFCITLCIVTGIIVFQLRRTRVIKGSNWILLEIFLFGAISIYTMIINAYFKPTEIACAIQPFLREGGFVLMYGVLYVKVYRVLCSFQSRKAQRVYVRDQDILRYLGVLVIICFGHLIAWVATSFDHKNTMEYTPFSEKRPMGTDFNYMSSHSCRSKYWDIVSYMYETGLMLITIYYCKCVKSAPSEYGEVRFITIAVINESIISLLAIITRMTIRDKVNPQYIFIIYFLHCHLTTTASVALLIGPKLWYLYRPPILSAGRPRLVPHSETHIIQTQHKLNGDVDLVEINLAEMDSETIRDELKRLYTQLEIYKTRAMRKDNPHVSRKRGGRKQRRFSLQHFHKKHHTTSGHEDETSKISEDSGGNSGGEEANLTSTSNKLT